MPMRTQSLPATDYQTLYVKAEQRAEFYRDAYEKILDKYLSKYEAELGITPKKTRQPIDPFILSKMGRETEVAQSKLDSHECADFSI